MTLITLQTFESEFHLRSLPCAFSRQLTFVLVCSTLFAAADHVQEIAVLWERLSELRSHFRFQLPQNRPLGLVSFQQFGFSGSATIFSLNNIGPESENISDLSTSVIPRSRRD